MTAGRLAKEKEAYGHHGPSSWQQQQQQQQQFGAFGPGPAALGGMGGGGGTAQGLRRFSGSEGDRSGSGDIPAVMENEVWLCITLIWMKRVDKEGMPVDGLKKRGGYIWLVDLERNKFNSTNLGPSGGKPAPRDGPNPSGVLVHRDGGRVPEPQQLKTPEGSERGTVCRDN
ncbi:hypothetical protein K435DRAFT_873955 [Dendrothele bispora CBS 962.96]|uniref:Uncharacterized protein n=1 Tax=Dendrothele bispora (strain CBS 962.96) TaxID=1314807 RepID=A0A4S8KYX5_DENBC|nr:hypothetical protein K435DRAFT_873955 [Dendrothele bispora CBS 962.96]